MKKKLLSVIFACVLAVGFVSGDISETNRWSFVHNKLIVEPEQTWTGWVHRNFKVLAPAAATIPGFTGMALSGGLTFMEALSGRGQIDPILRTVFRYSAVATVVLPVVTIYAMKHFRSRLNDEAFKVYVKNWNEFKEKTPGVLHKTFDKVSAGYDQSLEPEKYLDNAARLLVGDVIKIITDSSWLVE